MPTALDLGGLSRKELAKRVWKGINDDDVFGRAAQLAYYFLLALFPGLIFVTAILGMLTGPSSQIREALIRYIGAAMPGEAFHLVQQIFQQTTQASGGGKVAIGIILALWSASAGFAALQDTLNVVYNVKDQRPFWKSRGLAVLLTVACSVLALVALSIIFYGNEAADFAAARLGLGSFITTASKIAQWPIAIFFVMLTFAVIYYAAPDVEQRHWQWISPGAVLGILLWLVADFAFRAYLHFFNSYSATYGTLGGVIILMLWFYVTGAAILIGGEVNAEVENAAAERGEPGAKHKGQRVPLVA